MLWYANIIVGMHTAFCSNNKYISTHNTIAYNMKIILHWLVQPSTKAGINIMHIDYIATLSIQVVSSWP